MTTRSALIHRTTMQMERELCAIKADDVAAGERAMQHASRKAGDRQDTLIHMYAAQTAENIAAAIRKGAP
jgi:hypothetical protein